MTAVRDLAFAHRFTLYGGGPHLARVDVDADAPLTADGVSTFVRYRDAVATRYGYVSSRWAVAKDGGVLAEVLLYVVDGSADGAPRRHPDDPRLRQVAELYATTDPGSVPPSTVPSGDPPVWARREAGGQPVPASLAPSEQLGGVTRVAVLGAGVVPPDAVLLMARPGLADEAAAGPVGADVYAYTRRNAEKVAAQVRAGRARPTARLTFGTLEQLTEGPAR